MPKASSPSPSVAAATEFVDAADQLKAHEQSIMLFVEGWKTYQQKTFDNAKWTTRIFRKETAKHIPEKPGVYAFLILPNAAGDLNVSYLMYVGETDRTLRERFREYLREARSDKIRPKLLRVLPLYPDHLFFACCPLPIDVAPTAVEAALLQAFLPPGNDQVPASVRRPKRAFS